MGCGCGKRTMDSMTSVNVAGGSAPDRPDIAAAKEAARQRVDAAMSGDTTKAKASA
jgi:hypothetical protein